MAKMLGVSRRTVKKYEEGTDTTPSTAAKIEEIIGTFAIKEIDLLNFVEANVTEEEEVEGEEGEIIEQLRVIGLSVYPVKQAPFDAVSQAKEDQILTGFKQVREIEKRARLLGRISEAINTEAAYITDKVCKKKVESVVFVLKEELYSVSNAKDFISLLKEKSCEE